MAQFALVACNGCGVARGGYHTPDCPLRALDGATTELRRRIEELTAERASLRELTVELQRQLDAWLATTWQTPEQALGCIASWKAEEESWAEESAQLRKDLATERAAREQAEEKRRYFEARAAESAERTQQVERERDEHKAAREQAEKERDDAVQEECDLRVEWEAECKRRTLAEVELEHAAARALARVKEWQDAHLDAQERGAREAVARRAAETALASAQATIARVRAVPLWSLCKAEPEPEDDEPLYTGMLTDQGGSWIRIDDLLAALTSHPSPAPVAKDEKAHLMGKLSEALKEKRAAETALASALILLDKWCAVARVEGEAYGSLYEESNALTSHPAPVALPAGLATERAAREQAETDEEHWRTVTGFSDAETCQVHIRSIEGLHEQAERERDTALAERNTWRNSFEECAERVKELEAALSNASTERVLAQLDLKEALSWETSANQEHEARVAAETALGSALELCESGIASNSYMLRGAVLSQIRDLLASHPSPVPVAAQSLEQGLVGALLRLLDRYEGCPAEDYADAWWTARSLLRGHREQLALAGIAPIAAPCAGCAAAGELLQTSFFDKAQPEWADKCRSWLKDHP